MRFIDVLLAEYGQINRSALEAFFDLSTPQASIDFRTYMEICPGNMEYDKSAKAYLRLPSFQRRWL
jgi:hypothetical protein